MIFCGQLPNQSDKRRISPAARLFEQVYNRPLTSKTVEDKLEVEKIQCHSNAIAIGKSSHRITSLLGVGSVLMDLHELQQSYMSENINLNVSICFVPSNCRRVEGNFTSFTHARCGTVWKRGFSDGCGWLQVSWNMDWIAILAGRPSAQTNHLALHGWVLWIPNKDNQDHQKHLSASPSTPRHP